MAAVAIDTTVRNFAGALQAVVLLFLWHMLLISAIHQNHSSHLWQQAWKLFTNYSHTFV